MVGRKPAPYLLSARGAANIVPRMARPAPARSPRNNFAIVQEFPSELLRGVKRELHRGVSAFGNIALGMPAAHVGLHPARAHGIYAAI